jgi:hypothetical protein
MEAAQYESLGRADDALLVKMLQAGLQKLKAGNHGARRACVLPLASIRMPAESFTVQMLCTRCLSPGICTPRGGSHLPYT